MDEASLSDEGTYGPVGDWLWGRALPANVCPKAVIFEVNSHINETRWLSGCSSTHWFGDTSFLEVS